MNICCIHKENQCQHFFLLKGNCYYRVQEPVLVNLPYLSHAAKDSSWTIEDSLMELPLVELLVRYNSHHDSRCIVKYLYHSPPLFPDDEDTYKSAWL